MENGYVGGWFEYHRNKCHIDPKGFVQVWNCDTKYWRENKLDIEFSQIDFSKAINIPEGQLDPKRGTLTAPAGISVPNYNRTPVSDMNVFRQDVLKGTVDHIPNFVAMSEMAEKVSVFVSSSMFGIVLCVSAAPRPVTLSLI